MVCEWQHLKREKVYKVATYIPAKMYLITEPKTEPGENFNDDYTPKGVQADCQPCMSEMSGDQ